MGCLSAKVYFGVIPHNVLFSTNMSAQNVTHACEREPLQLSNACMCTELPTDDEKNEIQRKIVALIDSQSLATGASAIEQIEMGSVPPSTNTAGDATRRLLVCYHSFAYSMVRLYYDEQMSHRALEPRNTASRDRVASSCI